MQKPVPRVSPRPDPHPRPAGASWERSLSARHRPPPVPRGASLPVVPARRGVCGCPGVEGGGVQAGGGPSGVSPLRPCRRAAGPRAGRLHRPSFCERRLPRAAWRAGPGHRASPGIASLPRRPPHAPPEPPDLPGQARGWGAGRGGAGLRA
nr:unnamed protein product [Rangifer tarandus platyrhynchus]